MEFKNFATAAAIFALLTTVGASVYFPNGEIPITLQSVFVLLSGLMAGANVGITSQLLYLGLGVFMPVYAGDRSGINILSDATAGYLLAFPVAAFVAGIVGYQGSILKVFLAVVLAQTSLYIGGTMVMKMNTDYSWSEVFRYGFVDLALMGYGKALFTGLLYIAYLKFAPKRKETI
jgi:biotin transport system substrate-specific component